MPAFRIVPERSWVWVRARSSMHPIHGEASGLEGSIEAELNDGRLHLNGTSRIQIQLPVDRLASGNSFEDAEMMRRIDARRYPTITGEVREIKETTGGYSLLGDLTFHGVTRPVEGAVTVSAPDGHTIVLEGEQTFDIRDFGVQPPKLLMLRVNPDVKVRVRVVAEQEGH